MGLLKNEVNSSDEKKECVLKINIKDDNFTSLIEREWKLNFDLLVEDEIFYLEMIPVEKDLNINISIFVDKTLKEGEDYNLHIKRERPISNVIKVIINTLFNGSIAPQPIDLRPARYSRLHLVPHVVARNSLDKLSLKLRPFRPWTNKAH